MKQAIEKVLCQIRPKITVILRTRQHYGEADLIGQFKTHVWGIIEQNSGAIFHAARYLLEKLDATQNNFLQKLDLNEDVVFLKLLCAAQFMSRHWNIGHVP